MFGVLYVDALRTCHPAEPSWRAVGQLSHYELPPACRPWLLDDGSLTQRLVQASNGHFRVRRLSQEWRVPQSGERQPLQLASRQRALVREVLLECHGSPWVFARSVLPARTLAGRFRYLRRFGDNSLGELLFRTSGTRRDPFEVCRLAPRNTVVPARWQGDAVLWGRRSRFWLAGLPLLVCEFFLPGHQLGPL